MEIDDTSNAINFRLFTSELHKWCKCALEVTLRQLTGLRVKRLVEDTDIMGLLKNSSLSFRQCESVSGYVSQIG